jgi:hypothetical protein
VSTPAGQPSGTGAARAKRSETRFCRIPQWLYSTGISLQAIAAYGWLHGKYGYLKRINPSYATLAEELGVSRGSIINYFKELVRVGAVRVTVGGPKGRTINSYQIAFDAPFAFSSGQRADHSNGDHESVVSPLTTTSQRADQTCGPSGQPVVPEEEVLKNFEDSLSSDAPASTAPELPATGERETEAAPGKATAAQRAVRASGVVSAAEEQAFIAWATAKFDIKGPGWWKTCAADIPEHAEAWRASQTSSSRPAVVLPPWCGECDGEELHLRWLEGESGAYRCPKCNPHAANAA